MNLNHASYQKHFCCELAVFPLQKRPLETTGGCCAQVKRRQAARPASRLRLQWALLAGTLCGRGRSGCSPWRHLRSRHEHAMQ